MKTIALIACSGSKCREAENNHKSEFKAQELYTGKTFVLARDKGVKKFHCDDFFIISAKHHLLEKDKMITWYDVQLKSSVIDHENNDKEGNGETNSQWAKKVLEQLEQKGFDLKKDKFVIFGGRNYYKNLVKHLNCRFYQFKRGQYSLKEENLDFNDMGWKELLNGGK